MALILSGDTGPSFVQSAAMPTGSVLQVVQTTYGTQISTTSGTMTATGVTATITPKFNTSKILISVNLDGVASWVNNGNGSNFSIYKNGSLLQKLTDTAAYGPNTYVDVGSVSGNYLDSPATTSATTYTIYWNRSVGSGTMYLNNGGGGSGIVLIEIAG